MWWEHDGSCLLNEWMNVGVCHPEESHISTLEFWKLELRHFQRSLLSGLETKHKHSFSSYWFSIIGLKNLFIRIYRSQDPPSILSSFVFTLAVSSHALVCSRLSGSHTRVIFGTSCLCLIFLPVLRGSNAAQLLRLIVAAAVLRSFSNGNILSPVAMQSLHPNVIIGIRHSPPRGEGQSFLPWCVEIWFDWTACAPRYVLAGSRPFLQLML